MGVVYLLESGGICINNGRSWKYEYQGDGVRVPRRWDSRTKEMGFEYRGDGIRVLRRGLRTKYQGDSLSTKGRGD